MPRLPSFTTSAISELHRQLQYAPRETRARQMEAAELLVDDIDPVGQYPEDFLVWRITGYRPDMVDGLRTFAGAELIADLVVFVQRVSRAVELKEIETPRDPITLELLEAQLEVSRKTLQRYRKRGLVCHYIVTRGEGEPMRLVCFADALDRFRRRHAGGLDRAARFTRLSPEDEFAIISAARGLAAQGMTLNEAADRLARAHGRAHETVRGVLKRHERRAEFPIFAEHGPLTERDGRLIARAAERGVGFGAIAGRFGKTTSSIRRAHNRERARMLCSWPITWRALPTLELDDADAVILAAPAVNSGLDRLLTSDLTGLLQYVHDAPVAPDENEAAALAAGLNVLKRRAVARIDDFGRFPSARALDAAETDLRWASRLKRRLIALAIPGALERVDQFLHRPLAELPGESIVMLVKRCVAVCAQVADTLDPSLQRIERRAAYDTDRALAGLKPDRPHRASARHEHGAVGLPDLLSIANVWDSDLDLSRSLRAHVGAIAAAPRALMERRYGLGEGPPCTVATFAEELDRPEAGIKRSLDAAYRTLLTLRREARA